MSKRNWFNGFAFGVVAGFLLTPALIFAAIVLSGAPDYLGDTNASHQNGDQATPQDQHWWLIARVVYMDDTAAQWIMMIATIIATILLLRTLWATQNMARDTREIGEAQTRSWLQIRLKAPGGLLASNKSLPFGLLLDVTNIGNGPATNVLFDVWLYQSIRHHDENEIVGLRDKLIERVETEHIRPSTILPSETQCRHRAEALPIDRSAVMPFLGGVLPAACVVAVYKTTTDKKWHCTAAIFDLYIRDATGIGLGYPFPLDGEAVPGERINIVMRRNAIGT